MCILLTGFEPFGGDTENASAAVVRRVLVDGTGPVVVVGGILPVTFDGAPATLRALLARHRPAAVLAVGEAGGRSAITPEARARNLMDARIADNTGDRPRLRTIDDGPEWAALPYSAVAAAAAIRAAGVPATVSDDPGTFVCNRIARQLAGLTIPAGFVHIPAVRRGRPARVGPETDDAPLAESGLSLDDVTRAVRCCLDTFLDDVPKSR